jgi:hypothetical protein
MTIALPNRGFRVWLRGVEGTTVLALGVFCVTLAAVLTVFFAIRATEFDEARKIYQDVSADFVGKIALCVAGNHR